MLYSGGGGVWSVLYSGGGCVECALFGSGVCSIRDEGCALFGMRGVLYSG